jgi:hypothetical protein
MEQQRKVMILLRGDRSEGAEILEMYTKPCPLLHGTPVITLLGLSQGAEPLTGTGEAGGGAVVGKCVGAGGVLCTMMQGGG